MTMVGGIGLGLVALSVGGVLLGALVLVARPAIRLRRALRANAEVLEEYRQTLAAAQWALREAERERMLLLRPVARVRRVLMHPLVAALLDSYWRRRRGRRAAHSVAGA